MSNLAYLSILAVIPIGLGIWYASQSTEGKQTIRQMATPGNLEGQMLQNEVGRSWMGIKRNPYEPVINNGENEEQENDRRSSYNGPNSYDEPNPLYDDEYDRMRLSKDYDENGKYIGGKRRRSKRKKPSRKRKTRSKA